MGGRSTNTRAFLSGVGLAAFMWLAQAPARAADPLQVAAPAVPDEALPAIAPTAAHWSIAAATQLAEVIEGCGAEGLDPGDYQAGALRHAVREGPGPTLDMVADAAALALAHDYLFGRVIDRGQMGWMIERSPYEAGQLPALLRTAVASGQVAAFLGGLLPADARYAALRAALADASDRATRDRLRVNLERARWLPRTLSSDYIYVNVPSYRLAVMDGGEAVSTYTVVVGARDTPTPMLISPASSVVVNPWWNVPQSIIRKSNMRPGRGGFQFTSQAGGSYSVRQPPGARNALGRIKFNLQNDQAIYLHDTPAKSGFAKDDRALSHGCVRVKDIERLAAELMERGGDGAELRTALAQRQTETLRLPQTWPVYIVYFTADVGEDGQIAAYPDPYGYDARVLAALGDRPLQVASRAD